MTDDDARPAKEQMQDLTIVSGNHDVDRAAIDDSQTEWINGLTDANKINVVLHLNSIQ